MERFCSINSSTRTKQRCGKSGIVEQYELFDDSKGRVDARRARQFKVGGQLEGCVADDELGFLYVGEEAVGIWKYRAEPEASLERTKVDGVTETDGIYVTTASLGSSFPEGVFIAQDGADDTGKQNFKLVPWQLIMKD